MKEEALRCVPRDHGGFVGAVLEEAHVYALQHLSSDLFDSFIASVLDVHVYRHRFTVVIQLMQ